MTDHKFTDETIIKAAEHCFLKRECDGCPIERGESDASCIKDLRQSVPDILNRQKAEIERLNKEVDRLSQCVLYHDGIVSDLEKDVFNAKSEAIKEFAERLKLKFRIKYTHSKPCEDLIDILVKEMTEGRK